MLPNLIVIGAQKCGTSALHYYLGFHPEVSMSTPKELNFFIRERNWKQGVEWYEEHFRADANIIGESSPNYTAYPHFRGVPRRMHSLVPDAKLIYLVRDPLQRIVSQYVHNYSKRRRREASRGWMAKDDLATTVLEPGSTYIPRSRYHTQLQRFLRFFPESNVLVLGQDDLLDEREETMRKVFRFLGIDESFYHPRYSRLRHQTQMKERKTRLALLADRLPEPISKRLGERIAVSAPVERPVVDDGLRRELTERLKDDIDALRDYTGRRFESWSI